MKHKISFIIKSTAIILCSALLGMLIDMNYDLYKGITNFEPFVERFIVVTALLFFIKIVVSLIDNDKNRTKRFLSPLSFSNKKPDLLEYITGTLVVFYAGVNIGFVAIIAVIYSFKEVSRLSCKNLV